MWIIIARIICLAATIGMLAIAYELDKQTPRLIRHLLVGFSIAFFAVFLLTLNGRIGYHTSAGIALAGLGVMTIAVVTYMALSHSIQPVVLRLSGAALAIIVLVWLVGSCSDIKRQQLQMEHSADTTRVQSDTSTHY